MLQISKTGDLPTPESSLRRWSSGRDWPGLSQLGGIYQGLCGRGGWKMGCWKSGCVSNWIDLGSLNVFRMIRGRIRSKGARVETCWWKMSYAKKLKDMLLHASLAGHGMGQNDSFLIAEIWRLWLCHQANLVLWSKQIVKNEFEVTCTIPNWWLLTNQNYHYGIGVTLNQ